MNEEKLRVIAQSEFIEHERQYSRLQGMVDTFITQMEYHARQMNNWNEYLASLSLNAVVEAPVASREGATRRLYLVRDALRDDPDQAG